MTQPQPDAPADQPLEVEGPPTALGFGIRLIPIVLWVAIGAAVLIPLFKANGAAAAAVALLFAGIGRALLAAPKSWGAGILAIPVSLGVAMSLILAPPMLTLLTGERTAYTVGEFSDGMWCTVTEVDGDSVIERMSCQSSNVRWEVGSTVELYTGGVLPHTMDDGTPWEADRLERNYGWTPVLAVVSLAGALVLRIVKVWQTYWRARRAAVAP